MKQNINLMVGETQYEDFFEDILWNGDDWETAEKERCVDQRRWVNVMECTLQHTKTGRFFNFCWENPATEQQEGSESDDVTVIEVEPYTVEVTKYRPISQDSNE